MNTEELIKNAIPATQGYYIYSNPDDEKWRYNPLRLKNRELVERLFAIGKHTDYPKHIIIEVTNLCNLGCDFCNREVMTRPVQSLPFEYYKKIVDEAAELSVHSISLYMLGEPFLHKEIREFVNYAKKMGIPYVDISTNGHYDMRRILGTALNELIISIDGNDKETYEKMRAKSNWEKVIKNCEEFLSARKEGKYEYPFVRMQIIDAMQTHHQISGFVERWIGKADVIYIKTFEEMRQSFDEEHSKKYRIKEISEETRIPCKQLFFTQNVNSNGDISLCCHDPHGKLVVGNISQMTLKEAWESEMANYFRKSHKNKIYPSICGPCKDWKW